MPDNKPLIGSLIDWSHPQAAGLKMFHVLNEAGGAPLDLVNDRRSVVAGAPGWTNSVGGIGRGGYTVSDYDDVTPPSPILGVTYPCWIAAGFFVTSVPGTILFAGAGTTGSGNQYFLRSNTNIDARLTIRTAANANIDISAVIPSLTDGKSHVMAGVSYSATDHRLYLDGIQVASGVGNLGVLASNRYTLGLGFQSTPVNPLSNGSLLWHQSGSGSVPDMELLAREPFAAIQSHQTRRYFVLPLTTATGSIATTLGSVTLSAAATTVAPPGRTATFAPTMADTSFASSATTASPSSRTATITVATGTVTLASTASTATPGSTTATFTPTVGPFSLAASVTTVSPSSTSAAFRPTLADAALASVATFASSSSGHTYPALVAIRDRDVFTQIGIALRASGLFEKVVLYAEPWSSRLAADEYPYCSIYPSGWAQTQEGGPKATVRHVRYRLVLAVCEQEEDVAYESLDRIEAAVVNLLHGSSNNGLTLEEFSMLSSGRIDATGYPERKIEIEAKFAYLWGSATGLSVAV